MIVHREDTSAVELVDIAEWRARLLARVRAGMRPVTLYGRRDGEHVVVTAVLQDGARLKLSRMIVEPAHGYHELTSDLPALHCFERELHEQHGVRIAGHPWLKPIRFEGQDQAAMASYPFYRVDGKEVHEVAVGPIHAGVIEPGSFRFMCFGEHVLHLEIQLGYQHRGVEARLLERDPRTLAPWAETIAGDTSIGHCWAYCAAIESLAHVELDPELALARGVTLELERIAMHLAGLSGLAADVGFLPGASTYGRLRTTAILFHVRLALHAETRERHGFKPFFADRLLANLTDAVGAGFKTLERFLDFVDRVLLTRDEAQRKLAVEIVGAGIGHVKAVTAELARSFAAGALEVVAS